MCFMCEGGTLEQLFRQTRERIGAHGFTMVSVENRKSSWTYTIGLVETTSHPELVVTGLGADNAQALITDLVAHIKAGERFESGDASLHGLPLRVGTVHPTQWVHGRFAMWVNYYGERGEPVPTPAAVQILWPNDDDVFPPDRDFCNVHRECQPVLSVLVAHDVNQPIGRPRGRRKKKGRR